MNLIHLAAFTRVVDTGSFSAAARALQVPTSSVSRSVAALEADLGVQLFERTTRLVTPTALGLTFAEHARRAIAELEEGERRVGELQHEPRGEVRITAPGDLDDGFFARCLVRFSAAHPRIRVTGQITNRYVDLVSEGVDMAMRVADALPDSSLVARRLGRYRGWLVASPEYLTRRGHPRTVADLARHDCVLTGTREGVARWTLVGPAGDETVEVKGRIAVDDLCVARDLMLASAGIGVLPIAPGAAEPHDLGLVRVLPQWTLHTPSLFVVVPSAKRLPSRVALLRDFLVAAYAAV